MKTIGPRTTLAGATASLAAACLCLAAPAGAGDDDAEARRRLHPWARFADGANVSIEVRATGGTILTATETLVKLSDEGCTVQRVIEEVGSEKRKASVSTWALAFGGWAHAAPDAKKDGEATVDVGGKKYACTIWRAVWKAGKSEIVERTWMADGVDLPLRIETTSGGSKRELIASELDVEVTIGSKKVRGARYVGETETNGVRGTVETLRSLDVPGGVVASRTSRPGPKGDLVNVNEVVAFEAPPR